MRIRRTRSRSSSAALGHVARRRDGAAGRSQRGTIAPAAQSDFERADAAIRALFSESYAALSSSGRTVRPAERHQPDRSFPMNFTSDNITGASPKILQAIVDSNADLRHLMGPTLGPRTRKRGCPPSSTRTSRWFWSERERAATPWRCPPSCRPARPCSVTRRPMSSRTNAGHRSSSAAARSWSASPGSMER